MSTEVYPTGIPNIDIHLRWHGGEHKMQKLARTPESVLNAARFFRPFLTLQHQDFVQNLQYMFLGTLDEHGRPWVSMLTGPPGFMQSSDPKVLEIKTKAAIVPSSSLSSSSAQHVSRGKSHSATVVQDPILHNFVHGERFVDQDKAGGSRPKTYWGGVALDFSNRRRNKMNGVLYPDGVVRLDEATGDLHVRLTVEQTIGNCPKYITIREVRPRSDRDTSDIQGQQHVQHVPQEQIAAANNHEHQGAGQGSSAPQQTSKSTSTTTTLLSDYEQHMIRQADCVFLATRYIDDSLPAQTNGMDCNHRGGNPGFVRVKGNTILIPDYSGNRFFQSLGNIVNDPRIGLLFIDFNTGDTLHITGRAKVHLDAEAQAVYPRVQRVVVVEIDDVLLQRQALPFVLETKELSPYNPRIMRPTNHALHGDDGGDDDKSGDQLPSQHVNKARLMRIDRLSHNVASFYFRTTEPIKYTPGQYAVLDFSAFNTVGYQHMNNDRPQSVNDDFIRTWTISSAPKVKALGASRPSDAHHERSIDNNSNNNSNKKLIEWEAQNEFTVTVKRKPDGAISNLLHGLTEYYEDREKIGVGMEQQQGQQGDPGRGALHHRPLLEIPFVGVDGDFVLPVPSPPTTDPSSVVVAAAAAAAVAKDVSLLSSPREEGETGETPETRQLHSSAAANATSEPRFGSNFASVPALVPVPADHDVAAGSSSWILNSSDVSSPAAATVAELDPSPLPPIRLVFLAGGIGVTPFLSMVSGIQEILLARAAAAAAAAVDHDIDGQRSSKPLFAYDVDLLVSGSTYDDTLAQVLESLVQRNNLIPEGWRDQLRLRVTALVSDSSSIPDGSTLGAALNEATGSEDALRNASSLDAALSARSTPATTTAGTTAAAAAASGVRMVRARLSKERLAALVPDLEDWRVTTRSFGSSTVPESADAAASSPQKPQLQQLQPKQQQQQQQQRYQQTKVLLCGPASYMEAAKKFLQELQVPVSCVHTEEFTY
ncbi:hypothetical protein BGZ73_001625 [Actinomortierella ambigua]|nr:hypothetical protein BGZ73_001625 [Actinomortierella ambigua]